jgi:putative inorganic carbon (HCO3(-)) transporter
MDGSLFFRAVGGIFAFCQRAFSGSALHVVLAEPADESVLEASIFARLITGCFGQLEKMRDRLSEIYEASFLCKAALALASLARGSLAGRLFCQEFGLESEERDQSWLGVWIMVIVAVGACLGLLWFKPLTVIIAVAAFAGAVAAFCRPEIGIVGVVGLAPFMPTMVIAAMLGYIALCFLLKLALDKRYSPAIDLTGIIVVVYVIVGLFYGATSFAPSSSIKIALLVTLLVLSYPLVLALIDTKKKLSFCLFVFASSAGVTGVYGLYQKLSGKVDTTWVDRSMFSDVTLRIYSTFQNPNVYGTYLLLAIPICLAMAYCAAKWIGKAYYLGISVLLALNLAWTFSRGCYLALGLAAVVFILFVNKRLIILFCAGLFAVPFMLPASMINRIASIANFGAGDSSTSYRIYIWQATLRILKDFWISGLGQGIEAYNVVYPLYAFSNVTAPHSHNLYLQVFVETGIFGLLVFLALLASFFKTQVPFFFKTRNTKTKVLCAAFISAVIAFLGQGMFDYVFYNYRVTLSFFIFLGLGNALVRMRLKGDFC